MNAHYEQDGQLEELPAMFDYFRFCRDVTQIGERWAASRE